MHTPSKLALDTLSELQRQAADDFGLKAFDPDAAIGGASIAAGIAQADGAFDDPAKSSWLKRIRQSIRTLGQKKPVTQRQDLFDQALISAAYEALVARTAHISNVKLPPRIVLGSLPIGQVNAFTISIEDTNEFIVLFQRGLFGTLNLLARVVALAWPEADQPGGALSITADRSLALARLRRDPAIGGYVVDVLRHTLLMGNPQSLAVVPMAANRDGMKETILLNAEMFVIGHEFGHIMRSHFSPARDRTARSGNLALTVKSRSHQEEFAADLTAFELTTAFCTLDPVALCLCYYGCCFFLSCQDFLERALTVFPELPNEARLRDTHPAGTQRRAAITNVLRSHIGHESTKLLEDAYGTIQAVLDFAWEAAKEDWTRLVASGAKPAAAWASALECQVRPEDGRFEVEAADKTLQELGFGDSKNLEQMKGAAFLPLFNFFGGEGTDKDEAAQWLLENAHLPVVCLIHELALEPNLRGIQLLDYLVKQKPALSQWVNTLRFTVERYPGNRDILGVPEVLPQLGIGVRYLQSLVGKYLEGAEADYQMLFFEAARIEHETLFGRPQ